MTDIAHSGRATWLPAQRAQGVDISSRPASSRTYGYTGLAGLAFSLPLIYLLQMPAQARVCLVAGLIALPIIARIVWNRDGLFFAPVVNQLDWSRVCTKFIGLTAIWVLTIGAYWMFPEYHGGFYDPYFDTLWYVLPVLGLLAVPYLAFVDVRQDASRDGGWMMGAAVQMRWNEVDGAALLQFLLGWAVKGFFLPLMFIFLLDDLKWINEYYRDWDAVTAAQILEDLIRAIFLADVAFAATGYMFTFRLLNTHIRSTEPTAGGWLVATMCYQPFWAGIFSPRYLSYGEANWHQWLGQLPALHILWGLLICLFLGTYTWATVVFGIRFSNLTNRGIITHGPYRWSKHPAYLCKNLSWWLISVPFLAANPQDAVRNCLALAGVNLIYFARAKTEERHLMRDPDYVAYAEWMRRNGFIARICAWAPSWVSSNPYPAAAVPSPAGVAETCAVEAAE